MSSKSSLSPKEYWCSKCKKEVVSRPMSEATTKNKLLNVFLCPFGYCFIPNELQKFRVLVHRCPECKGKLNNSPENEIKDEII